MKRSTERILTTHTGSLPRPADLLDQLKAKDAGTLANRASFDTRVRNAVTEVVRQQVHAGVDVVNDGELGKVDYSTYIKERLTGFEGGTTPAGTNRESKKFPGFWGERGMGVGAPYIRRPVCTGPIAWRDFSAVEADIANLKAACKPNAPHDVFMTAVSPGQAARFLGNRHYRTHEAYLRALGVAMKREYDAIAKAGFILQVDCPDLGSGWNNMFADATKAQFVEMVELHLEVLAGATQDVPSEQLRLHLCWGNYNGPHTEDIPLAEIIGPVLRSRAGAISFEGANPRHEHEWTLWEQVKLPAGKLIIPGVIDSTSNFVEHPELIAQRLARYAKLVGRENVMAGSDCGFGTFAGRPGVHPEVVWAKFEAMAEGARIASKALWS